MSNLLADMEADVKTPTIGDNSLKEMSDLCAEQAAIEEEIKQFFIQSGFKITKQKKVKLEKKDAETFYKVHETKPFYNDLCNYLSSGPIVAMILEKVDAVSENRKVMGATDPAKADEGTIRKKYGLSIDKNSVHGSDSIENATKEINFFFET